MTDSDDTMAAKRPTAQVDDDTVAAKTAPSSEAAETPEAFDFQEWLQGLTPMRAYYEFAGLTVTLQARTLEWLGDFAEAHKEGDPIEGDLMFLQAHIVEPEMTLDDLRVIYAQRQLECASMVRLARDIDVKPESQISPRFLRGASD